MINTMEIEFSIGRDKYYNRSMMTSVLIFKEYWGFNTYTIMLYCISETTINLYKMIGEKTIYKYINNYIRNYITLNRERYPSLGPMDIICPNSIIQRFDIDPSRLCFLNSDWEYLMKSNTYKDDRPKVSGLRNKLISLGTVFL